MRKFIDINRLFKTRLFLTVFALTACAFQPLYSNNPTIKVACIGNSITFGHVVIFACISFFFGASPKLFFMRYGT